MEVIRRLACQFREAIDKASDEGEFIYDSAFRSFPTGCCGDASDLLAEFLLKNGIETTYVCGTYSDDSFDNTQSHAWLHVNKKAIIVDITGDQFRFNPVFQSYDKPVYVGSEDDFHSLFEERESYERCGISNLGEECHARLYKLYDAIMKYI